MIILIILVIGFGINYYIRFVNLSKEYNDLVNNKNEFIKLSESIDLYKKYSDSYKLVVDDGLSLEEKLKGLEDDVNTKSERVSYYKNSINSLNNKMK